MQRISGPDAIAGLFNDNPTVQSPTTRVSAAWLNDVQENIAQAIEGAGIVLTPGDGGQLLAAIQALAGVFATPPGTKGEFYLLTAPAGWLAFDGAEYLKADYPALVAAWTADSLLVDGSTAAHFVVPDFEGYFSRSSSSDATRDPDGPRVPGAAVQADAFKSHAHTLPSNTGNDSGNGYIEDDNGSGTPRSAVTGAAGGTETRPVNVPFLWCVKT